MSSGFLDPAILIDGGPRRFNASIARLLEHLGFADVRDVDGAGDQGGDIVAALGRERFVVQCKWTSRESVGRAGVDEVERAKGVYRADRSVVVTNAEFAPSARKRRDALSRVGVEVELWSGTDLRELFAELPLSSPALPTLRPYQLAAAKAVVADLESDGRALLILATGLGKTVVGGDVISTLIEKHGGLDVLVVAHMKELVRQLERSLWRHLPKEVTTQVLTGDEKPSRLDGVTCATVESALSAVRDGYRPGLIMVDETHHVGESGHFQELLDECSGAEQFGVTATPWRGDKFDIASRFGEASFTMGIAEGMAQGYLAEVDYSLLVDNIDWSFVRNQSERDYSIRELNSRLFLPERDEAMIDHLHRAWSETRDPRAIVFCQTIEHAERVAELLSRQSVEWRNTAAIHSGMSKREREIVLADFRLGRVPIITTRDILNEGVDVPDVNIICFLRVTHSRRIFVQQLGRGLRLREGKTRVRVLDFITDLRRIAAALNIRRKLASLEAQAPTETLGLDGHSSIEFSDSNVESIMDAWIKDAASLETAAEEVKLQFPFAG